MQQGSQCGAYLWFLWEIIIWVSTQLSFKCLEARWIVCGFVLIVNLLWSFGKTFLLFDLLIWYVSLSMCICENVCVCECVRACVRWREHLYVCVRMNVCVCTCVPGCEHVCVCVSVSRTHRNCCLCVFPIPRERTETSKRNNTERNTKREIK